MIKNSKLIGTVIDEPFGWKKFKVGDLFKSVMPASKITEQFSVSDVKRKPSGFVNGISATSNNHGVGFHCQTDDMPLNNLVTISANGSGTGAMFYQTEPFVLVQDSYAVQSIPEELNNGYGYLFFISAQRLNMTKYNYSNKAGWSRVKNDFICMPVTEQGTPDYAFIESYVKELEKAHVKALETSRVQETKNYMTVANLSDTTLTSKEQETLDLWRAHEQSLGGGGVNP